MWPKWSRFREGQGRQSEVWKTTAKVCSLFQGVELNLMYLCFRRAELDISNSEMESIARNGGFTFARGSQAETLEAVGDAVENFFTSSWLH